MAKVKTTFFCQNCGAQSPKWMGKCPSCGEWNTFVEEVIQRDDKKGFRKPDGRSAQPVKITDVVQSVERRINTHDHELNRVLGGGLVTGSVVLIGGEPGIGKSTLMLQVGTKNQGICRCCTSAERRASSSSGCAPTGSGSTMKTCYILTETNTQAIFQHLEVPEARDDHC